MPPRPVSLTRRLHRRAKPPALQLVHSPSRGLLQSFVELHADVSLTHPKKFALRYQDGSERKLYPSGAKALLESLVKGNGPPLSRLCQAGSRVTGNAGSFTEERVLPKLQFCDSYRHCRGVAAWLEPRRGKESTALKKK